LTSIPSADFLRPSFPLSFSLFRYRLLRGLPHLLLLIDGDTTEGSYNVFKQKKLKLDDVKKLFKQYPILVCNARWSPWPFPV
jgi:lantibiotic modifying enzyme